MYKKGTNEQKLMNERGMVRVLGSFKGHQGHAKVMYDKEDVMICNILYHVHDCLKNLPAIMRN